jgi:hypothetical protein
MSNNDDENNTIRVNFRRYSQRTIELRVPVSYFFVYNFLHYLNEYMGQEMDEADILFNESNKPLERKENINIYSVSCKYNKENFKENSECSICKEEFKENEEVSMIDCKHIFHNNCIEEWGKFKSDCPLCRKQISLKM